MRNHLESKKAQLQEGVYVGFINGPTLQKIKLIALCIVTVSCLYAFGLSSLQTMLLTALIGTICFAIFPTAVGSQVRYNQTAEKELLATIVSQNVQHREDQKEIARLKEIAKLSNIDELTNLNSRSFFERQSSIIEAETRRSGSAIGLMMIDVDGLKGINDSLGHKAGDELIKEAAKLIRETIRMNDTAIRYGGDEFIVIFHPTNDGNTDSLELRLTQKLSQFNFSFKGVMIAASASIGSAIEQNPNSTFSLDQMIESADKPMYAAKKSKKG